MCVAVLCEAQTCVIARKQLIATHQVQSSSGMHSSACTPQYGWDNPLAPGLEHKGGKPRSKWRNSTVAFFLAEDLTECPAPMHPVMALVCNWEGKGQLACFTAMRSPEDSPVNAIYGAYCLLNLYSALLLL